MRGAVVEAAGGEGRGSLGPQGHWVKERKRRQQPGAVGKCVLPHRACKYRCRPWGSGQDQCGGRRRRTDRDMWPPSRRDNQCHRPSARVSASSAVLPASLRLSPPPPPCHPSLAAAPAPASMDDSIPSIQTAGVGSRFVSQNELEAAKARRDEQWKAAYARCLYRPISVLHTRLTTLRTRLRLGLAKNRPRSPQKMLSTEEVSQRCVLAPATLSRRIGL